MNASSQYGGFAHWLADQHARATQPLLDLAGSTGPQWTIGELAELAEEAMIPETCALRYVDPQGAPALRRGIADWLGVDPDWVVITNGASEALWLSFAALRDHRSGLVLPDPSYPEYLSMAGFLQCAVRTYPMLREGVAGAILAEAGPDAMACLVNTPHNPTGAVMQQAEIAALADALAGRGIALIVDEVFHPIYRGDPQPTSAGLANVITIGDFSKALSLPGLRTGWLIDADRARRERIIGLRGALAISGSPLLEEVAIRALTLRETLLAQTGRNVARNRDTLARLVADAPNVDWAITDGGTVCFPGMRRGSLGLDDWAAFAREEGVLVAPGAFFGTDRHVRIGLGGPVEEFALAAPQVVARLERAGA